MTSWKPHVVAFAGNLHRPSRSRALAEYLGQRVLAQVEASLTVLDVLDGGPGLGAALQRGDLTPEAAALVHALETADALIVTSPVYKGSYTGLFKHALDFIDPLALEGKPVLIGATGGGQRHALVVEHQFRPLFGFFSALVAPSTIYASDGEFQDGRPAEPGLLARIEGAAAQFGELLSLKGARRKPLSAVA